jgi:multiple sugar transport system permease protein
LGCPVAYVKRNPDMTPYVMLGGAVIILLALTVFPLVYSLALSFHKWSLTKPGPWRFVGLLNYWDILKNPVFWRVIMNTFVFTVSAVTLQFVIGLGLAHLFYRELRGESVLRSTLVLPMMVPPILIGLIWLFMYKKDFGIINNMLKLLSIEPITWLSKPSTAMSAIIIADVWQWTPFMFLLLLAGLKSLPVELFESARIDGASSWQIFRYVTLPLLKPIIAIAIIIRFMDAFREFDKIFQLTGGGPGVATETISLFIYRNGFRYFKMGYASALSYLTLIIIVAFTMVYIRAVRRSAGR